MYKKVHLIIVTVLVLSTMINSLLLFVEDRGIKSIKVLVLLLLMSLTLIVAFIKNVRFKYYLLTLVLMLCVYCCMAFQLSPFQQVFVHLVVIHSLIKHGIDFNERKKEREFEVLKNEVFRYRSHIVNHHSFVLDVDDIKLTDAEYELLEYLCIYRASNLDIGAALNKSESTIKNQLKSIMDKAGADDRHHLIEMLRHNFI